MSTDTTSLSDDSKKTAALTGVGRRKTSGFYTTIQRVLKPLASLKLTVVLFALSIFLVFAGTLAQTKMDIWAVVHGYFRTWVAYIEFQVFLPAPFFSKKPPEIPGGIFFPGGWAIGTLLALNLFSAHLVRFKAQARGTRLYAGLGVILLGIIVTALVIFSGSMGNGMQDKPFVSYDILWKFFLTGLAVLWLVLTGSIVSLDMENSKNTRTLHTVLSVVSVALGALLAWLFVLQWRGEETPLSDPSMRILWQLTQASIASFVLLAGCIMVFKKRGGMVMLHVGVAVLMFSELLVGIIAVEERMDIVEGEVARYAFDIRTVEMAIIDPSDLEKQHVVVIPKSILNAVSNFESKNIISRTFSKWIYGKPNPIISRDSLPFDVRVDQFYQNGVIERTPTSKEDYPHIQGFGVRNSATPVTASTGVEGASVDNSIVYVTLLKKMKEGGKTIAEKDRVIGTWLLSCYLDREESVLFNGKTRLVSLRFKRSYKPYTIELKDFRDDKYTGTMETKNFSSTIQLVDKRNNVDREIDIWMNNPLRYAGETFYQSGHDKDKRTGKEITSLSVVTNVGWMMPYVACMLVWWGMLAHFSQMLIRFSAQGIQLVSQGKQQLKASTQHSESPRSSSLATIQKFLPLLIVVIFAGWFASKARSPKAPEEKPNPQAFAQLPVAYQGRVKPFDSLARNSLIVISNKSELSVTIKNKTKLTKNKVEKRPAINWLLDLMVHQDKADRYEIFRIVNMSVLSFLDLPVKKSHLYSFEDIAKSSSKFPGEAIKARKAQKAKENLTAYQRKIIELDNRVRQYLMIRNSVYLPPENFKSSYKQIDYLMGVPLGKRQLSTAPLGIPQPAKETTSRGDKRNWELIYEAAAKVWIYEKAKKEGLKNIEEFSTFCVNEIMKDGGLSDLVNAQMIEEFLPKALALEMKKIFPEKTKQELLKIAQERIRKKEIPPKALEALRMVSQQLASIEIAQKVNNNLAMTITSIMGTTDLTIPPDPVAVKFIAILKAYRNDDVAAYNNAIAEYRDELKARSFEEIDLGKSKFEVFFNQTSSFYYSAFLYIFAFLFAMFSFIGWREPLRKSAFWLIVFTFAIHTFAVLARIYISGRPPVTNLYSSAAFIGWATVLAGIVIELIFQIGLGNIIAAVTGAAALGIAHFLSQDGEDTITVMKAVLDSQFWLATHVVCISLGYAATFLAGMIGIYSVIVRTLSLLLISKQSIKETKEIMRILYRITYGVICFAIFFSFVGTVLGGLWADDSWGRFWGWDTKENGALIIVLWNALVLHARWGGMVKERGFAMLVIVGNIVTAWSWFGVNELGIGLHSYGFTEGALMALGIFIISQLLILSLGFIPSKTDPVVTSQITNHQDVPKE
ncbi:Putative cytochrome C-type biogenesis protein [hydrothermal vent metagenome]|uniref:Cytochrome C-type biogenesis protein n=1 Tax=hydrothermal vent metagenome TaxID=652676 RepID=A0A3B1DW44_9ZZZZ